MNRQRINAIIAKDLREVLANRMAVVPMAVVPLVFAVVLPLVMVIMVFSLADFQVSQAQLIEGMIKLYEVPARFAALPESMLWVFLNYTFIPMLIIVPIMVSIVVAANAVTGEKERHTLETLLSTPVTREEFMAAKVLAAFIPACLVGLVSFLLYFASANIAGLALRGCLVVDSWIWLPVVLLISPAVSLLGLSVTLLVSLKARTFMEAQQTAAMLVLPCLLLLVGQMTGVLVLSPLLLVAFGLALLGLDALLILKVAPRFDREKIINLL